MSPQNSHNEPFLWLHLGKSTKKNDVSSKRERNKLSPKGLSLKVLHDRNVELDPKSHVCSSRKNINFSGPQGTSKSCSSEK